MTPADLVIQWALDQGYEANCVFSGYADNLCDCIEICKSDDYDFNGLKRKSLRLVVYNDESKWVQSGIVKSLTLSTWMEPERDSEFSLNLADPDFFEVLGECVRRKFGDPVGPFI